MEITMEVAQWRDCGSRRDFIESRPGISVVISQLDASGPSMMR